MNKTAWKILLAASILGPAAALAQGGKTPPTTATYITKEEIAKISATEQSKSTLDENAKVVDLGYENFSLGIVHRGTTRNPAPAGAGGGAAAAKPCGRTMATLPPGGTPGGITHDFQTEGYYIVSGGGTMFTDGYIVNGREAPQEAPGGPNGPTCSGMAYGVKKVVVKAGDVIISPPNVVHGWADIPDHVDYLSFRPSQHVMQAGWVNPTIAQK
jgi:mannose-6-phosphate isomerase-like protein (cupin superfamily)